MEVLNGASFDRLQQAIKAAELRQGVISNNVANADTPFFKRSEVIFEDYLERVMSEPQANGLPVKKTHAKHLSPGQAAIPVQTRVVTDNSTAMNNNVNNVDIDREMSLLAKNQLRYNLLISQMNHDVKMMRTAIEGRV
ncbi:flagellar basal body rod protein FlgB [Paenibacillus sp. 1P07SE]|uniref:flagellar basal body rod protein FlgB n=1 Tax=Paenibacillus sp. 1P07SE TaxID=3132209 RepID=UPI0039A56738